MGEYFQDVLEVACNDNLYAFLCTHMPEHKHYLDSASHKVQNAGIMKLLYQHTSFDLERLTQDLLLSYHAGVYCTEFCIHSPTVVDSMENSTYFVDLAEDAVAKKIRRKEIRKRIINRYPDYEVADQIIVRLALEESYHAFTQGIANALLLTAENCTKELDYLRNCMQENRFQKYIGILKKDLSSLVKYVED